MLMKCDSEYQMNMSLYNFTNIRLRWLPAPYTLAQQGYLRRRMPKIKMAFQENMRCLGFMEAVANLSFLNILSAIPTDKSLA